ncbi:MAG: hypothetical protein H8D56_27095 [Planctomycetes bacterium]|nr:hypothetical protein [Planctomycetota bacterium]MBL7146738.1 hypothetical protein [Phycisphaerae bacterium]
MKRQRITIIILTVLLILVPSSAFACSTPVFRYALERWAADYYEAVFIHRGPLTQDEKQLLDKLRQEGSEEGPFLNLRVLEMDITTSTEEKVKTLLMSEKFPETLPVLVLWYPWQKGRTPPIWKGRLTPSTVKAFLQSPVRQKLAEYLTEGQTAVWIFFESGNAAKDKAALGLLEKELETATQELKDEAESMPDELAGPELKYEFSILPVSRSDPNESVLLSLLLNSEPDLDEYSGEPVIFPVFGRGRALYALIGEGINTDNIREAVAFVVGPCGCEIKMMNPGVDLLMAANWDAAAMQFYEEFYETYNEVPALTGVMPEAPTAKLDTESKAVENTLSSDVLESDSTQALAADEQAPTVEVKKQKILGLGLMGTTGLMLAIIILAAILGTVALSPRRKGQL